MLLLSLRGAVAAAPETIVQPGTYEPVVAGFDPAVYLKFTETSGSFADGSGNGRIGTLKGTGAVAGVSALAPNVGSTNKALNLGSAAWVEIPHAASDTALTTSYASPWEGDHTGNRFIADCTVSLWFKPNSLPTGSNKHVIVAKSSSATPGVAASYAETHPMLATAGSVVPGGSWEAYIDANGAVHVEVRSFRGRPCRIRTPNSAVSAGTTYHLVVQLSYDGVAAWLNGAKFEDGYANLLHVYGLAANIRGIEFRNNYAWTIGRAAWGGQANLIVDEFAVFLRTPTDTISQANINTLAQKSSTPSPLAHFIWGQRSVNRSSFASINAAIDNVNSLGGGTVLINPGTYTENVTFKSNVRLKANGGTVTINGTVRSGSPALGSTIGVGSGTFETGSRTLTVNNSRAVGDLIRVQGTPGSLTAARWDRRWNSTGESNEPSLPDSQLFEIESRNSSSMTFTGNGSAFDFRNGSINILANVNPVTPTSWIALEGDLRFRSPSNCISLSWAKQVRMVGITATNTSTNADNQGIDFIASLFVQMRNVTNIQASLDNPTSPQENDGVYAQFGTSDLVAKDCLTREGRHGFDQAGHTNGAISCRGEFHNVEWINNNSRIGVGGISAALLAHNAADSIYWNTTVNCGGSGGAGWKNDIRWGVWGDPNEATAAIDINDGAKGSYLRDLRLRVWFESFEGTVSVDNCHFANITRTANPTRTPHVGMSYGAGSLANSYNNVDGPHASWTAV